MADNTPPPLPESEILCEIESLNLDYGRGVRDLDGFPELELGRAYAQNKLLENLPRKQQPAAIKEYEKRILAELKDKIAQAIGLYLTAPEIAEEVKQKHNIGEYKSRLAGLLEGWAVAARELTAIAERTYRRDSKAWETTEHYFYGDSAQGNRITKLRRFHLFKKLYRLFQRYTFLQRTAITRNIVRIFIAVGIEKPPFNKAFQKWEKYHTRRRKQTLV